MLEGIKPCKVMKFFEEISNIPRKSGEEDKIVEYLKKFSKDTQFLVITHRKGTMEAADTVYGITMEENGISKLLSMKLK